ncbi:MAG: Pseudouridine synthase TruB, C-terminal, partial [Firmicutes bacterium]|nr:Pseudouridine synthase TruB, C-terminal [Bacillota bacterium]
GQKIIMKNTDIQNSLVRIYENDNDFIGIGEFDINKVLITPIKVITR